MDEIERVIYINKLLQIYGELLTSNQKDIMSDYYEANLSLSEIAEERSISRTAVDDAIKKSIEKLEKYEKTLQILHKQEELQQLLRKLDSNNVEEIKDEIERRIL